MSDLIMEHRAEQSEVLTEDVQSAEKHVELLKQTCGNMSRKINSVLSTSKTNFPKFVVYFYFQLF